jgi:hypothetical protein
MGFYPFPGKLFYMQVRNATKKTVIVRNVESADSYFSKMQGLMGREELASDSGMLMKFGHEGKHSIWMMGMKFPIDIIYIGKDMRVVGVVKRAKPLSLNPATWKVFSPREKCVYVLEVDAGVATWTRTREGDLLEFR